MRILYISGDVGVEVGGRKGAATHVRETCHNLMRFGHEVLLVTPAVGDRSQIEVPLVEVKAPEVKWFGADFRHSMLNRRMHRAIEKAIDDFRPDAVYERYSLYQTAGSRICRKRGIARILEVNSLLADEQKSRLRVPWLARMVERHIWRHEKAIIAVSDTLKRLMIESAGIDEAGMAGFVITPVAVAPETFHPGVAPKQFAEAALAGRKIAGYMGTMTAWHGIELFFEAAKILSRGKHPVVILAVGGEPERVERLRERAVKLGVESHLVFLGSVAFSEVPSYLAAMDVCLIPHTQDWSSPTKFFEFAAMGRPIVAASLPAVHEVFGPDPECGLMFKPGDAADMVRKILAIAFDQGLAARLGRNARRRVLQNYTWDCNIRTVMHLYQKMGVRDAVPPPVRSDDPVSRELAAEDETDA